jgi:outer membrane protein
MKLRRPFVSFVLALGLAFVGGGAVGAQQITRIAVIDLQKVIMTNSKDSQAFKDFELKKAQVQAEIDRMAEEIKGLQAQKLDADKAGDKQKSLKIETDIYQKTQYLKDFVRAKQAELDAQAQALASSSSFVQLVYRQIQQIAESEGYSLVLNLKSADSVMSAVVWYSSMIDITDEVIQAIAQKTPTTP